MARSLGCAPMSAFSYPKGDNPMKREGDIRIPSGCAVAAVISTAGRRFGGGTIISAMKPMHERSNGLGGGFAAWGIYPEYRDCYALHLFFDDQKAKKECESFLKERFEIVRSERIPTRKNPNIRNEPIIWRFFAVPHPPMLRTAQLDEDEFVAGCVMHINTSIRGAYVFSSGKNMGTFKAVGYPEDVGDFYRLEEYEGYSWIAHGRYPTNTPGWWGGAHPFSLLERAVVHNGEISSYDANRRYLEMFGYRCSLQTDTEVITYILDFLVRRKGLSLTEASEVIAAPFWSIIEAEKDEERRERLTYLRRIFPSLLVTGPFSIVCGFTGGLMALNDRLKLRSMVTGQKDDMVYIASEEAAIRAMESGAENIRYPAGGECVIVNVKEGAF